MNSKSRKVNLRMNMGDIGNTAQDVVKQGTDIVEGAMGQVGGFQDQVNDTVTQITKPITQTANDVIRGLTKDDFDIFEGDKTSIARLFTEALGSVQRLTVAANIAITKLLSLDPKSQKNLVQVSQRGDELCKGMKGKLRMSIMLPNLQSPWGFQRWFDACIEGQTAQKVIAAVTKNPLDPITKFAECAVSEDLLKPLDSLIVDTKNSIGTAIGSLGTITDVVGTVRNGVQNMLDGINRFGAGSYTINPLAADTLTCFQYKMNDKKYPVVGFNEIMGDLASVDFITGRHDMKVRDVENEGLAQPSAQPTGVNQLMQGITSMVSSFIPGGNKQPEPEEAPAEFIPEEEGTPAEEMPYTAENLRASLRKLKKRELDEEEDAPIQAARNPRKKKTTPRTFARASSRDSCPLL